MRVAGDGVLDAADGEVLVGAEGEVVDAVLEQDLDLSVLLLVVAAQHLQVLSQLRHPPPQLLVLPQDHHVLPHRHLQLALQLPEPTQELLLHHWLVDVDRVLDGHLHLDGDLDWNLDDAFALDGLFDVDWLVDVDWLFDDGGHLDGDRPHHLLLDLAHHLHGHLLLDLDVLGHLHQLLDDALGASHQLGHLHDHLHWLLHDHLLHHLLGRPLAQPQHLLFPFPQQPPSQVQVDSHAVVLGFELGDELLVVSAGLGFGLVVVEFEGHARAFLLGLPEVVLETLDLLEELLEAVLGLVVLLDLDLNLLIALRRGCVGGQVLKVDLLVSGWNGDGRPRLHLLANVGFLLFEFGLLEGLAFAFDERLLLDDDGLLEGELLLGRLLRALPDHLHLLPLGLLLRQLRLQLLRLGLEARHSLFLLLNIIHIEQALPLWLAARLRPPRAT